MPLHIEHARQLCADGNVRNLTLHAVDFATANEIDLPNFDYIVVHGVYSWVAPSVREDVERFIDRHLKPGGLAFVSYNAMPGRANDVPFQHLLRALADASTGDSNEKFAKAMSQVRAYREAGAPALAQSYAATTAWEHWKYKQTAAYFVHEYLAGSWCSLYVTEVRAAMTRIGLVPAGSATIYDNFDSFMLRKSARRALADVHDADLRGLIRDFFIDQRFRRDVFARGARQIGDEERSKRLLGSVFDLRRPAELVQYETSTPAGCVKFDNRASRAIVAALAPGPRTLASITAEGLSSADLLANALALFAANQIRPVGPGWAEIEPLNRAFLSRLDGPEALPYLALPRGTAVRLESTILKSMRTGAPVPDEQKEWRNFLRRYGISVSEALLPSFHGGYTLFRAGGTAILVNASY
jgi:SAM-dependent methyltransferase